MSWAVSERKATIGDAIRLWWGMREIDREEAEIVTWWPVLLTLLWGVLFTEVRALRRNSTVLALYGSRDFGHLEPGLGYIWMLATHEAALEHNRPHVFIAAAAYVNLCQERYPVLGNAVYAKNVKALRFVQRLGFEVRPAVAVHGELFHPIARLACAESSRE